MYVHDQVSELQQQVKDMEAKVFDLSWSLRTASLGLLRLHWKLLQKSRSKSHANLEQKLLRRCLTVRGIFGSAILVGSYSPTNLHGT